MVKRLIVIVVILVVCSVQCNILASSSEGLIGKNNRLAGVFIKFKNYDDILSSFDNLEYELNRIQRELMECKNIVYLPIAGSNSTEIIWECNQIGYVRDLNCIYKASIYNIDKLILSVTIKNKFIGLTRQYVLNIKGKCNDRNYKWYYTQLNSGSYSNINCGPAVAAMAAKWFNKDFSGSVSDVRNIMGHEGCTFITQIFDYLRTIKVRCKYSELSNGDGFIGVLNRGNIIVTLVDMGKLYNDDIYLYNYHYIVIYGYYIDSGKIYFNVMDPFSEGLKSLDIERLENCISRVLSKDLVIMGS